MFISRKKYEETLSRAISQAKEIERKIIIERISAMVNEVTGTNNSDEYKLTIIKEYMDQVKGGKDESSSRPVF